MGGWQLGTTALIALSSALSVLLNFFLIRMNRGLSLTAVPRTDRWHRDPTPNSGGVAIFLSCGVVYGLAFQGLLKPVALGAAAMFLLGFLDDCFGLRPGTKIACEVIVAVLVVCSGMAFNATAWPLLNLAITVLWIVGLTNAFNLIDNMDGLCAGVAVTICLSRLGLLALLGDQSTIGIWSAVGAAFAGFLVFNHHPARIFMGDSGSLFAGFTLSTLALADALPGPRALPGDFLVPAMTFIYPIFDTVLVSFLRWRGGRAIWIGGRDHSSHRLTFLGIGEAKAVAILWLLTAAGAAAGLLTSWMPAAAIPAGVLLGGCFLVLGIRLSTLPPYQAAPRARQVGRISSGEMHAWAECPPELQPLRRTSTVSNKS